MLTYECGLGQYPFPVSFRLCSVEGDWSPMRLTNGRLVSQATCKGNGLDDDASYLTCTPQYFRLHPLFYPSSSLLLPDVLCPAQLQLDHGDFWPRDQWSSVGTTQTFSCQEGFTLYGSAQRNCTHSGEWTGTTPICDNHGEDGQQYKHYS